MFLEGLKLVCTFTNFSMMTLGVFVGLSFGAIPGLTFITGIIILLPLTFGVDPVSAVSLLLGVYCGGMTGGSVTSILLGIPGTPSAAATLFDGHEMHKKGESGKAMMMALIASVFGGLFSLLILSLVAPQIARAAIKLGPVELFAIVMMGFSTICRVSEKNLLKGLISGCIGLMITTVGLDPITGQQRYTFGSFHLMNGIDMMALLIGIFAFPEMIEILSSRDVVSYTEGKNYDSRIRMTFPTFKEIKGCLSVMIRSSIIGTIIGAIPGPSGPIAAFLSYDHAKSSSKHPERYGTGILEGVAAPESSNSAVSGGTMIPLLTLGIPGDNATAVILGAFLIHGLQPGPLLFRENGAFIYGILISLFFINILMFIIHYFGIRFFIKIFSISKIKLSVSILALCVIGSYASNLNYTNVYVMFFAGFIGYILLKCGFPTTPLLLGNVLGRIIEYNMRTSLILSKGDVSIFIRRPISLVVLILAVLILFNPQIKALILRIRKKNG